MAKLVWKIVIIGDPAVGKTSIRRRYLGETTIKEYIYTIGADFATKRIVLSDFLQVQYQIFDLAGQPKFDKVRSSFYAGAQAAILVYDITDNETLKNLPIWVREAMKNNDGTLDTFVVVGNKYDLKAQKQTDDELLKKFLKDLSKDMGHDILHIYTSALTGENIEMLFQMVTERLLTEASKDSPKIAKLQKQLQDELKKVEKASTKDQIIETKTEKTTEEITSSKDLTPIDKKINRLEMEINHLKSEVKELHQDIDYLKIILLKYLNEQKQTLDELSLGPGPEQIE